MMGSSGRRARAGRAPLAPLVVLMLCTSVSPFAQGSAEPAAERVVAIRVHGNHTTPDEQVLALAGVVPGAAFTPALPAAVQRRLESSGRFRSVEVRQRLASLSDPHQILLVIVVEELRGITLADPRPGPMRRVAGSTMWLPVLRRDDGYGFTYGARLAFVDALGPRTRVSVPLTWGGERRAAAEVERTFARGPLTRIQGTIGAWRREHPAADLPERRVEVTARAERALAPWLRLGGSVRRSTVWFGAPAQGASAAGADVVVDTSRNPAFPRNAIVARAAWERLWFDAAPDTTRATLAVAGYVGVRGASVVVLRAEHSRAGGPVPLYEQALLGGTASLRGFRVGHRAGDRLAAGSVELRLPVSSPMRVARTGFTIFGDAGSVYGAGTPLRAARFDTGIGAGVFAQWPVATLRLEVARGLGSGTRAHVSLGLAR